MKSKVKDKEFSLDEQLILIDALFLDIIVYDKRVLCVLTDSLNNLVKNGYLVLINEDGKYISYRCTKKGKKEGKIIVENIEKKYFKEAGSLIKNG